MLAIDLHIRQEGARVMYNRECGASSPYTSENKMIRHFYKRLAAYEVLKYLPLISRLQ